MRYVYQTVVGSTGGPNSDGYSTPVPIDTLVNPTSVGVGVNILSGSATYTVEHTFDDIYGGSFTPSTANWLPHVYLAGLTASSDGNYAFPVRAIRLHVSSGTGTVRMAVGQSGLI